MATPATLTPVGYLQFENGMLYAKDSPEFTDRFSLQQVTKLTIHPRIQLILQSEPFVRSSAGGTSASEKGGLSAGVQAVLVHGRNTRPTVSVSYLRSLYSGPAPDLDIGSASQSAVILLSDDLFGFHFDANGIVTEQSAGMLRRAQWGQTLSISHPLKEFTISGELWHFTQPLLRSNTIGNLWAVSYPVRNNLVFDAGFNHGFNSTSSSWEAMVGFTYLLPHRLWKMRQPKN